MSSEHWVSSMSVAVTKQSTSHFIRISIELRCSRRMHYFFRQQRQSSTLCWLEHFGKEKFEEEKNSNNWSLKRKWKNKRFSDHLEYLGRWESVCVCARARGRTIDCGWKYWGGSGREAAKLMPITMSWLRSSPLRQSFSRTSRSRSIDTTAADCDPKAVFDSFCKHWQQVYEIILRAEVTAHRRACVFRNKNVYI